MLMKQITLGSQASGEHWLQLSQKLEKTSLDRLHQLRRHGNWNKKNKKSIARDKAYKTIINEFKDGKFDHAEYVRKIVKLNRQSEIPRGR